jgi:uncharacterized protein (TIGR00730 family)
MSNQPLSYLNPEFMESEDARPLRILAEYFEPLRRFTEEGIEDTVVFFGSARMKSRAQARRELTKLKTRAGKGRLSREVKAEIARAEQALQWSKYYEEARTLAGMLTEWTATLDTPRRRFVVCSGGGPGIMEAANLGAHEAGGKSVGLAIRLPFEEAANRFIGSGLQFDFHYFFMRKFWFAYLAKALVVFPGGYGTLDEIFEILTLAQTRKLSSSLKVILYGSAYWDKILNLEPLAEFGAISPEDLDLIERVDTPKKAFAVLRDHLVTHHLEPHPLRPGPDIAKTQA